MEKTDISSTVKIVFCENEKEYCKKLTELSITDITKFYFFIDLSDSQRVVDDHMIFENLQNRDVLLVLSGIFDRKNISWFEEWAKKNQGEINWERLKVVVVSSRRDLYLLQADYRESFIPIINDVYRENCLEEVEIPRLTLAEVEDKIRRSGLNKDDYMMYMRGIPGLSDVLAHRHFLDIYLEKLPKWIEILRTKGLDLKKGEKVKGGCAASICRALLNAWYELVAKEEVKQGEKSAERVLFYRELAEELPG